MPYVNWDQANFTKGVLDPRAYARTDYEGYYQSAKTINNAIVIPQGGVQNRWGTTFVAQLDPTLNPIDHPEFTEISTLTYDDSAIYLLVWQKNLLQIYLENILVAFLATPYNAEDIANLRFTQVLDRIIASNGNFNPYQLVRSADANNNITNFNAGNSTLTLQNAGTQGFILPAIFSTSGALPTTVPQIYAGRTYYVKFITTTTIQIYSNPDDAANGINFYTISALGNNSLVNTQNTWAFNAINFINMPAYDYNGGYSALTFTPSATSGTITITASGNIFTAAMAGGVFTGNSGIARITTFTNPTTVSAYVETPFANTNAIPGSVSFLGEPAWSNTRGWPMYCSFFQNRLVFASNASLLNGVWLSVPNQVFNFDDSEPLADNAISWYPGSNQSNVIKALTAGRTLLVHTNTGNFSTPFSNEVPLTPTNFVLVEQNKDGVSNLQPVFIDNQVIYIDKSGNNVKNMIWEITQSSYVLNNISVASSFLIKNPVDMTAFTDPQFTDGYYVIFVNNDGTLCILQTLHEQQIAAFTSADSSYSRDGIIVSTDNGYQHVTSSVGKVWFITQRAVNHPGGTGAITGFTATTLTAIGIVPVGAAFQAAFITTGVLPTTNPQINLTQYWWVNGVTANTFSVYNNQADAIAQINPIQILNAGVNSSVVLAHVPQFQYIEQLNFNVNTDASITQTGVNSNVVNNLGPLEGNFVSVFADGVALQGGQVFNGSVTLSQVVQNVTVGIPFTVTLQLLPIGNIPGTPSNLYKRKHIRGMYINLYNTLGATIQGFPIILPSTIPNLTVPKSGVYEYGIMEDWDYTQYNITIQQSNPLPMTVLGVSYILELT